MFAMLHTAGLRSDHVEVASVASVGLCVGLWIRAKTVDQADRGHAEWRAVFVGLWPPVFLLLADALRAHES